MPRPIHFDLKADNPERAINFYREVFGWKFEKWEGGPMEYWMVITGDNQKEPGINGGLSRKDPGRHDMHNMNTVRVSSIDKFSKMIQDKGGKIVTPKTGIPGVGWFATCHDTEGNTFGIMEEDRRATNNKSME
jgi:predicted enzyme related to lactoylglutathione lyase